MSEENKYPKAIVGAFIFNDKGELFLTTGVKWHNKYVCPGGRIEAGEKIEDALRREVKEETNMNIEKMEFIGVADGYNVNDGYTNKDNHLIFLDYKAKVKDVKNIKLNDEALNYKWLSIDEWLKKDKKEFAPYTYRVIEKLKKIEEDDYSEKYKRALADYQNLLKRTAQEKQEFAKYANENLLHEIIPVYDNLKFALTYADSCGQMRTNADENGWSEGVKYVVKQFKDVLEKLGVEEIKTKNEKFNPELMEALEGKGKKVKKEVKAGYKLNGKVIVPAKVMLD